MRIPFFNRFRGNERRWNNWWPWANRAPRATTFGGSPIRITQRLIISLVLTAATVAGIFSYQQVRQERQRWREELDRRSRLLADSLQDSVIPKMSRGQNGNLTRLVERFGNRERLAGVAVYGDKAELLAVTPSLKERLETPPEVVQQTLGGLVPYSLFASFKDKRYLLYAWPMLSEGQTAGVLLIVNDAAFIDTQLRLIWRANFWRVLSQAALMSLVILLVVRWSVVGPIARLADWMRHMRAGDAPGAVPLPGADIFAPLMREAAHFARHLTMAKQAATEEARLRRESESLWTPDRLKEHVRLKLSGRPLFVISNREPYMHQRQGRKTQVVVPAGGLVTALDPVLRATGGTWIAHGSGDADWENVDDANRLRVPPEDPHYTLKRVSLTKEEEDGYYYGFSNEGLWPLCHIVHTRPTFRAEDWAHYKTANAKFAAAALEEMKDVEEPCVLIQDYHFALLPAMIKEKRPDARVALFWHIPWPNPEAFAICPWQRELLAGMLGADLISFHTQFHCNNFLETVDRTLESRTDWERFTVHRGGHSTLVKPFPISVHFPEPSTLPAAPDRAALLREVGVKADFLAVGVERLDYTKGVIERFQAVERFLDKYPQYQGRFTYVQIGEPSRTHIKRYHDFMAEVESEAERIQWKFKGRDWRPIVFLKRHHSREEILPYYLHADLCLVTSLHDGMNLVAKEFVAARADGGGALILSRFTGAARDLRDALLVNPYDIDQMADAIAFAIEMPFAERAERLARMRESVREHNIYRWAGELIEELTRVRLPMASTAPVRPIAS